MHVTRAHGMHVDEFRGEQAIGRGDGPQLEPGDLLGSATLVDIHVRGLSADHGFPGPAQ